MSKLQTEVQNLVMAIAQGGDIPELVAVLKDKKTKLAEVNGQQARSRPVLTEKDLQRRWRAIRRSVT